jgi:hypothetical protein
VSCCEFLSGSSERIWTSLRWGKITCTMIFHLISPPV